MGGMFFFCLRPALYTLGVIFHCIILGGFLSFPTAHDNFGFEYKWVCYPDPRKKNILFSLLVPHTNNTWCELLHCSVNG